MAKFKTCPKCGEQVSGCRTRFCTNPNCKHEFISKMSYKGEKSEEVIDACRKAVEEYNKGNDEEAEKILVEAGALAEKKIGAEKNVIIEKEKIPRKKRIVKPAANKEPINWHTLERGDIIKVSQMDGSTWKLQSGEEVPMGDKGSFRVISHDANGIHAWALGKKSGFHFIYMGPEIKTESGLIRKPHKILKVKKFIKLEEEEN